MAGKEDPVKNFGAAGLGSGVAEAEADLVSGGKRKAEDSEECAADVTEEVAAAAAAAAAAGDVFVDEATGIKYVDMPDSFLCWVLSQKRLSESTYDPRENTWMSQEEIEREVASVEFLKASQRGVQDEFFEFQAWVRETYETKGRVLVPEGSIPQEFLSEE